MAVESKAMDHIRKVLEQFGNKYFTSSGALKRTAVIEDLDSYDKDLMTALLSDDLLHKTYTSKIADVEIFEINKFVDMLKYKEYWADSFTKFNNKIGLTAGGKYIDDSEDVVLDFPYKDTVLKAGMTKEDVEHSGDADEPFLNETLAKPEIDELLEPKVLVNATKYDKNGKVKATSINGQDNLVVKGNNLIALYSLKERYAGKIKLIYLDPPYNTGHDSFQYNDKFNQSSWLTFMRSRLEVARDLLSDQGTLWMNIDDNENAYLQILTNEVFGISNYISNVIWNHAKQSKNDERFFANHYNNLLVYARNKDNISGFLEARTAEDNKAYRNPDDDPKGLWRSGDVRSPSLRETLKYNIVSPSGNIIKPPKNGWRWSETAVKEKIKTGEIKFKDDESGIIRKIYLSDQKGKMPENLWLGEKAGTTREANTGIKQLFGSAVFQTPKPEKLLKKIIAIGTSDNDIILDFFMGSATTQAVAMKMNRRFIGIDQMDYVDTVSVPRLEKVIKGEQGGISKDVNWQGGGSFIYAELMPKNQNFVKEIQEAQDIKTLFDIFDQMKKEADIDFRVDLDKFEQSISEPGTLIVLGDCKRALLKILDKNQLYYNYANIDDADVRSRISDSDYEFNKSFYSSSESGEE